MQARVATCVSMRFASAQIAGAISMKLLRLIIGRYASCTDCHELLDDKHYCVCSVTFSKLKAFLLIWLKLGREWSPLISTRDMPCEIVDAVKRAPPEWCQLQETAK